MSRLEVRHPELEVIELGEEFEPITHKGRVRVVSNASQAISVLGPGKRRTRLIETYQQQLPKPKPKVEVVVPVAPAVKVIEHIAEIADVAPTIVVDEQVEAEQFFNAVEPWVPPDSNDWFDSTLKFRLPNDSVIIGELTSDQLVWIHERDITVRHGGHSLCLPIGTKMAVRVAVNTKNPNRYSFLALECQIDCETDVKQESHLTGEITNWSGSLGGARLECGCSVPIGTASRDDLLDLQAGDRVEFDLVYHHKRKKFLGMNITVLESRPKE